MLTITLLCLFFRVNQVTVFLKHLPMHGLTYQNCFSTGIIHVLLYFPHTKCDADFLEREVCEVLSP